MLFLFMRTIKHGNLRLELPPLSTEEPHHFTLVLQSSSRIYCPLLYCLELV